MVQLQEIFKKQRFAQYLSQLEIETDGGRDRDTERETDRQGDGDRQTHEQRRIQHKKARETIESCCWRKSNERQWPPIIMHAAKSFATTKPGRTLIKINLPVGVTGF